MFGKDKNDKWYGWGSPVGLGIGAAGLGILLYSVAVFLGFIYWLKFLTR